MYLYAGSGERGRRLPRRSGSPASKSSRRRRLPGPSFIDGIGTSDPNPKHLVNRCFQYNLINLTFFKTGKLSGALVGVGGSDFIGYDLYSSQPEPEADEQQRPNKEFVLWIFWTFLLFEQEHN